MFKLILFLKKKKDRKEIKLFCDVIKMPDALFYMDFNEKKIILCFIYKKKIDPILKIKKRQY
jgi:hypothetical protein